MESLHRSISTGIQNVYESYWVTWYTYDE